VGVDEGSKLAQEVTLVSCIREVTVSTLGQYIDYHDWFINKVLVLVFILVVIRRAHCALLCLFSFIGHPANIK
jgi:hypothetical protein